MYLHNDRDYMLAHKPDTAPHLTPKHRKRNPTFRIVAMFERQSAYLWHELECLGEKQAVRAALKKMVNAGMLVREGQYYRTMAQHAADLRDGSQAITAELANKGYVKGYRTTTDWIREDVPEKTQAQVFTEVTA